MYKEEIYVVKEEIENEILDETRLQIKNSKDNLDTKCCYCAKEFTRPTKKEHEQICKLKHDFAIQLKYN